MITECYCFDIARARQLAARLCLNWQMPTCSMHDQPKQGCQHERIECVNCAKPFPVEQPKRECDCTQGLCRHGNFISGGSQHAECTHDNGVFRVGCMPWCKGKPDMVELKIHKLADEFRVHAALKETPGWFRAELRELVDLAKAKA